MNGRAGNLLRLTLVAALVLGTATCDGDSNLSEIRRDLDRAAESASDALETLGDRISDQARPLVEEARDRLGEIESDLEETGELAGREARDAYSDLRRRVDELREDLESTAGDARGEVREVWDRLRSALEELRSRIEQALDEVS